MVETFQMYLTLTHSSWTLLLEHSSYCFNYFMGFNAAANSGPESENLGAHNLGCFICTAQCYCLHYCAGKAAGKQCAAGELC